MTAAVPVEDARQCLRRLVEAPHDLLAQDADPLLLECHGTGVAAPHHTTMTTKGHEHLSVWLGQDDDRLLPGLPLLQQLLELFSCRLPPALKLVGDQAMLRLDLIVLCKGTSRFLLALLPLEAQRLGGVTLRLLRGLGRFETGVSGQGADRLQDWLADLLLHGGPTQAQTGWSSRTTIPPTQRPCCRTAFAPRAPLQCAATAATAPQTREQAIPLAHRSHRLILGCPAVRLGGDPLLMLCIPLPPDLVQFQ
jgi:hypothetical protein